MLTYLEKSTRSLYQLFHISHTYPRINLKRTFPKILKKTKSLNQSISSPIRLHDEIHQHTRFKQRLSRLHDRCSRVNLSAKSFCTRQPWPSSFTDFLSARSALTSLSFFFSFIFYLLASLVASRVGNRQTVNVSLTLTHQQHCLEDNRSAVN